MNWTLFNNMKTKHALILAALALAILPLHSQQVGPTATVLRTNVTTRIVRVKVTTSQVVERKTAPVVFQGGTNWLTKDKVLSESSVTNAVEDPTLRGGLKGLKQKNP